MTPNPSLEQTCNVLYVGLSCMPRIRPNKRIEFAPPGRDSQTASLFARGSFAALPDEEP
jgi:hypothetical protein